MKATKSSEFLRNSYIQLNDLYRRVKCKQPSLFYVDKKFNAPIPRTYWIEVSARCNLKCPFCPTANGSYYNKVNVMELETYKLIFEKIKDHARFIYFHKHGEPTLNKDLFKIVKHTSSYSNIYTLFSTNLNTRRYNLRKADELVDSGISEIIASIDGASENSYSRYRRGGSFSTALANLNEIANAKARLSSVTPKLNWQFLINSYNEHEIEDAKMVAKEIGSEIYFLLMDVWGNEDWMSSYHKDPLKFAALTEQSQIQSNCSKDITSISNVKTKLPNHAVAHVDDVAIHNHFPWWCAQLFHTMAINTDGSVSPCTEIADSRTNLGNILTEDINSLWNSESFKKSRRYVFNKEVSGSICESCVRGEGAISYSMK
ncbi:radical SAM protein [Photobacterium chitinilyticum]|uniref:Radical SAM protein n=1 Tax=Photobacterium chitinilyticum TaxID=2485123 RepID=A0A3S3UHR7_9GAMM|nr:radical SAM protein [Photobacterium chitinilyticum]RWX52736.1 radical SAM protein [Photobacterium chitinilyticum]